ncbi:MAG: hypothetical protein FWG70_06470 [Oscillospiraceae bacterium]|nr:hypothetical protein [Oscillospiraceae bacterium]
MTFIAIAVLWIIEIIITIFFEQDILVPVFFIIATAFIIAFRLLSMQKYDMLIICSGFLLCVIWLFIRNFLVIPGFLTIDTADAMGFHKVAFGFAEQGRVDVGGYGGFYSAVLGIIYIVFGSYRIIGEFVNILLYLGTALVIRNTLIFCRVSQKTKLISLAVFCFFPWSILVSNVTLRESVILFFFVLSVSSFIKYLKNDSQKEFILSVVFGLTAGFFHSGAMIAVPVYVLFWFIKTKSFFAKSAAVIIFISAFSFLAIREQDRINAYFGYFVYNMRNGLESLARFLTLDYGDSVYLEWIDASYINSVFDLLWVIPLKFIYFIGSPMPWDWRGFGDMVAYLTDTIIYLVLIFICIKLLIKNKSLNNKSIYAMILIFIVVACVYAAGTITAGTAIRHRYKLLVVLIFLYAMLRSKGSHIQMLSQKLKFNKELQKRGKA